MSVALDPVSPGPALDGPPKKWKDVFSFNNRFLPPILISCILLVGELEYGMLESWGRTGLAIGTAIGLELILGKFLVGKWPHLASAYISGISVGILVRSPFYWPFALCSALAITSKYVLRWDNRHIWNPSNFGLSVMFFLYPEVMASLSIQWGNTLWPMIVVWALGSIIIYRLKRFHICFVYVVSFLALSYVRTLVTGHPWASSVAPLTGPMYQLYVFFMITDPKTTVTPRWGQCVVAFLVALVEMIFRLGQEVHAPYYALFFVGPIARAVEILHARWTAKDFGRAFFPRER
jgi:Na+-transporting NADH:ubiquinone oxidoreductase subunit NqrB